MKLKSRILKIAIFATGLSGIVAEYILSTLATYFLGNSVVQWALIVSVMLFSMGLGSRISKYFERELLIKFIFIEFILSIFVSFAPLIAYTVAAYTIYVGLIIYLLSILIGLLIGMEIPLVIRINDELETLRINVSSVIENDYYGSLIGGIFFVFIGLPYLGITYTPFILGLVNFSVSIILLFIVYKKINEKFRVLLSVISVGVFLFLLSGLFLSRPIITYGEQIKYKDKIILSEQSKYQKIVITQWNNDYWLYINGNQQLSTLDEVMYHEPLVHPILKLSRNPANILILGGGDGCAVREILKDSRVKKITLVDLDPLMIKIAKENKIIKNLNENSLQNKKVEIINEDGFIFIQNTADYYDIIIIDLPDPRSIELGRLYSEEFYRRCFKIMHPHGYIITQAGSPYYATKSFLCIDKTLSKAGFTTARLHNQIVTMGEWGWILGSKSDEKNTLLRRLKTLKFDDVNTKWLNYEAMQLITSFGKNIYNINTDSVEVNRISNPVLYRYYLNGNWDIY